MKRTLLFFLSFFACLSSYNQCVNCDSTNINSLGNNSSILGTNTSASGISSFASGINSSAIGNYSSSIGNNNYSLGHNSVSIGTNCKSEGLYSVSIGKNVEVKNTSYGFGRDIKITGVNSVVLGSGISSSRPLVSNIANSLSIGVMSEEPSLVIRKLNYNDILANIGIGTESPQKLLHINGSTLISGSDNELLFSESELVSGEIGFRYRQGGLSLFVPETNTSILRLLKNGKIGIGTDSPTVPLEVNGVIKGTYFTATQSISSKNLYNSGLLVTKNLRLTGFTNTDLEVLVIGTGNNVSTKPVTYFRDGLGDHVASNNLNLNGYSIVNGEGSGIFVSETGNVGIGTTSPNRKLSVNGCIRSKEVVVEISNWPDYVFESEYELPSLSYIENYIKLNKHLPDVPSASMIKEGGVNLGETNAILLQKIEELTLYIIQLEKEINKLKDINDKK